MTEGGSGPPPSLPKATLPTISDTRFGFLTQEWINPNQSVFKSLSSPEHQHRRLADDAYRQTVSPTAWSRFVHLGRPSTTGFDFDKTWNNFDSDPSLLYQLIWNTYLYNVDRKLDTPIKLEHWATTAAQPYLAAHSPQNLLVDTLQTPWSSIKKKYEPWIEVGNNKHTASMMQIQIIKTSLNSFNRVLSYPKPILPGNIPPIPEKSDEVPEAAQNPKNQDSASKASSDAKQSALVIPTLLNIQFNNPPFNNGTHTDTFCMKTKIDANKVEKELSEIHNTIQELQLAIFSEDAGYMYRWTRDELADPKVVLVVTSFLHAGYHDYAHSGNGNLLCQIWIRNTRSNYLEKQSGNKRNPSRFSDNSINNLLKPEEYKQKAGCGGLYSTEISKSDTPNQIISSELEKQASRKHVRF